MLLAEFSYRFLKLPTEWTRKIAHVGSGIIALSYPFYIHTHWIVFALTISFMVILFTSKKMGLFQSIFSVGRKSSGELFFVISSWLLFWLYQETENLLYFYLPFSVVVFADPAAALIGTYFPLKKYTIFANTKSYGGSLAFFLVTFILYALLACDILSFQLLFKAFLFSLVLALVEAFSSKGWDNLTIPLIGVLLLYLL